MAVCRGLKHESERLRAYATGLVPAHAQERADLHFNTRHPTWPPAIMGSARFRRLEVSREFDGWRERCDG